MKSKFLYQDVDVVSLADKGIVAKCFVCRNYDKHLMETGKLCDNIRVTKMDSCLVLTEYLSHQILRLSTSSIALILSLSHFHEMVMKSCTIAMKILS